MTGPASEIGLSFGDVQGSQLVFGDHNVIQTPAGAKVTFLHVGERPVPQLRPLPLAHSGDGPPPIGRDGALALAAGASPDGPLQIYGRSGIGKTTLLKAVAGRPAGAPEGVVLVPARRRDLDEIAARLYTAFWDCSPPYLPTPAEIGGYLHDRAALILVDDCGLDRDDVDALLDMAPHSTFVLTGERQTLWTRGGAHQLSGLEPADGAALVERELGRALDAAERAAAERLAVDVGGEPQRLVEAAAAVAAGTATLAELSGGGSPASPLDDADRRVLATLDLLPGTALGAERVAAVADVPDAVRRLAELERRGWVKSSSPRYRLVREPPAPAEAAPGGEAKLLDRLLDELTRWSARPSAADAVADESEAVEAALARATRDGRWRQALALARAAEPQLARAGAWTVWRRVLATGLDAARALRDTSAEARMLHQLGSLELCLGARDRAREMLGQALELRERLGERDGAALTRHNLDQLGGGGGGGDDFDPGADKGGGSGGLRLPVLGGALAILGAVLIVAALTVLGGEPAADRAAETGGQGAGPGSPATANGGQTRGAAKDRKVTAAQRRDNNSPTISLSSPADGATYGTRDAVTAAYSCEDTESKVVLCEGTVPVGAPIDLSPGTHSFAVRTSDAAGNEGSLEVTYEVSRGGYEPAPPPEPTPPPDTTTEPELYLR